MFSLFLSAPTLGMARQMKFAVKNCLLSLLNSFSEEKEEMIRGETKEGELKENVRQSFHKEKNIALLCGYFK